MIECANDYLGLYRGFHQIAALDLTRSTYRFSIASAYDYAPFGAVTAAGIDQPIQWSSEFYDAELALVYYNFRHYNPMDGRWISRDPIEEEEGWNMYNFSKNASDIYVDRLGKSCFSECLDDHDYTTLIVDSILAYIVGGPIPKAWVPAFFDALGYHRLARQARVGMKIGKKTITTIPSTLSVTLRAGGRSILRTVGRVVSPIAILMTALDVMIAGYCGWPCFWNDCYNSKTDNMWKRIDNKVKNVFND